MDDVQLERRLTTLEQNGQYMADQLVDIEENQNEIRSLAMSVNTLAIQLKRLVDDMCAANVRLDRIEAAPGRRLDQIIGWIIAAIIGCVVTVAVTKFMN